MICLNNAIFPVLVSVELEAHGVKAARVGTSELNVSCWQKQFGE